MSSLATQTPAPLQSRISRWVLPAILAVLVCAAYSNSYRGAFVYDDGLCLTEPTQAISRWWPSSDATQRNYTTGARRWLTHLTFVANYKVHGYHVAGYHVVNNAIHLAAGLCLFGLVRRTLLLPATRERFARSANGLAFTVAALWLVHPLQTESVTYIVQRLESFAGLLFLLSLYLVLRGSGSRFAWAWYLTACAVVAIGTGAKETMFLAAPAILFYDRVYLSRTWSELWQKRWGLYTLLLPSLLYAWLRLQPSFAEGTKSNMGFGFRGVTPWEYLRTQPEVILHYLKLCFWPSEQCIDYGWRVQNDPWMIYGLGAVIVLLVAGALALLWLRPRLGFVACMFFFVLAPTSSFMPIRDLAFEHRMYLALACVVIGVVLGMDALLQRLLESDKSRRIAFAALSTTVVLALSMRTFDRNRIYHDPIALWKEVSVRSPWNSRAAYNVGHLLLQRARVPGGMAQYQHLLLHDAWELDRISKREVHAPVTGDFAEAITWFEKTLEIDPQDASAAFNIAGVYDLGGEPEAAIVWYEKALAINKQHLNARINLARLLADRGDVEAGERQFQIALGQAPQDGRVHLNYGRMLASAGRHSQALSEYDLAREHKAPAGLVDYRVALSQWELGQEREAIEALRKLRQTRQPRGEVSAALAKCLALTTDPQLYQPAEGAAIAMEVVQQAPSAEAFEALAVCQTELKQYDAAAISIERGLELAEKLHDARRIATLRTLRKELPSHVSASSS